MHLINQTKINYHLFGNFFFTPMISKFPSVFSFDIYPWNRPFQFFWVHSVHWLFEKSQNFSHTIFPNTQTIKPLLFHLVLPWMNYSWKSHKFSLPVPLYSWFLHQHLWCKGSHWNSSKAKSTQQHDHMHCIVFFWQFLTKDGCLKGNVEWSVIELLAVPHYGL